jgi:hypothetical protein
MADVSPQLLAKEVLAMELLAIGSRVRSIVKQRQIVASISSIN